MPQEGEENRTETGIVTDAMARAGALELRDRTLGEDLKEIVTDVFYVMWAARHDPS